MKIMFPDCSPRMKFGDFYVILIHRLIELNRLYRLCCLSKIFKIRSTVKKLLLGGIFMKILRLLPNTEIWNIFMLPYSCICRAGSIGIFLVKIG